MEKQNNGVAPRQHETLDKGALNGLRGLFAFHVMAFHACLFLAGGVKPKVNLYASVDMPLFFLLSGFSLALAYGKTIWNGSTRGCFGCKASSSDGIDLESPEQQPKIFDSWEFYKKRLFRILPLHYLGHVLVLIVWKFGVWPASVDDMWIGSGLSIFAINTWVLPYNNFGPNGPSWTICTLFFWYWCFPFILPRLQRLKDDEIAYGIVKYFWLNVGIAILLIFGLGGIVGEHEQIYWMMTAHPLFRFPVFLMGVLGGLQVVRAHNNGDTFEDPNLNKNLLHVIQPWGCGSKSCCSKNVSEESKSQKISKEKSIKIWKKRVDFSSCVYAGFLTALVVTKVVLDVMYVGDDRIIYIGAHRNENGSFIWPNGTSEEFDEFTFWDKGQPGNDGGKKNCRNDCREQCVAYFGEDIMDIKDIKWHDVPCTEKYRFICQYEQCLQETCFEGRFYNISESKASYKEATEICTNSGGSLLIVDNEKLQNFTTELISSKDVPRLNKYVEFFFKSDDFWGTYLQIFAVHIQLTIIVGLCMDAGKSFTSRFLRTKMMQFLGRISLSLYLLHWSLMGYVILAINGPQEYETEAEIWEAYSSQKLTVPFGSPMILVIISPIVCFIVTKYFEEPVTKILRGTK